MFALRSAKGAHAVDGGFVLPRWLRRPVRMVSRLRIDEINPPPFAATIATAILFSATGLYGGLQGGHLDEVVQATTSRVGFAISDVQIAGNVETSEIDVLQQIGLDGWTSMVGFSASNARERIAQLPWVESATVRKVYPGTVEVSVVERQAYALWQRGQTVSVVEMDGAIIAPYSRSHHAVLPLVIGEGANEIAPEIVSLVEAVPQLQGRVKAFIRVADRRWDLRLDNDVTIQLPEHGYAAAVREVAELDAQYQLFSRAVTAVDMRVPDRITVAMTAEAAEERSDAFEAKLKALKKGARI
ncbi:cell division protein FtsQ/DivIB [Nitratireductor basaltis]|uniref:Cell division protein FtsQ n=1 Tax=Nitratireductor basaltis TaxID=472175 RepID=A0A084U9R3_9HYPH|nr:cell division protein FtsQ/DivIB [Nitratireductor basaltis]KFB09699.1 Cell division protein FtsQ [Nitratireductor basaltis]